MKRITCILIAVFGGIFSLLAQEVNVQGTVTDENNIPLLGVNVLVKDQSSGTTTDFDGNYSIQVPSGTILSFRM